MACQGHREREVCRWGIRAARQADIRRLGAHGSPLLSPRKKKRKWAVEAAEQEGKPRDSDWSRR